MLSRRENAVGTQLYVWGCDSHGQLGLPQNTSSRVHNLPKMISILHSIKSISCGEKHIAFITLDGDVFTQGCNADGKLGIDDRSVKVSNVPVRVHLPLPALKIHCGMSHTLCILENGDVYAWGFGQYGALGVGQFKTKWKPTKVFLEAIRVKNISAGAMHSSFISTNGDLFMCGSNDYGELGTNRKQKISVPTLVNTKTRILEASCGIFYTLLLDQHGRAYSMGNNKYGQLGTGSKAPETQPTLVKGLQNQFIVKIQSGYHSGALSEKGELFLWGSGTFGEHLRPHKIKKSFPFIDLSIGGFFGCAVDSKHNVYTWGNNNSGQLGHGHFENAKQLTEVSFLRGKNTDRIFCGVNFVIALTINNNLPHRSSTPTARQHAHRQRNQSQERMQEARPNEIRNTVREFQQNQRILIEQRKTLQSKLQSLAIDYEKLSKKYEMIEIIVEEKQKIIGIYESKIKQLSRNTNGLEQLTHENRHLKQEIRRLNDTIERNAQIYSDKLKSKDDIIVKLEKAQGQFIQQLSVMRSQLKLSENLLKQRMQDDRVSAARVARLADNQGMLNKYETLLKQRDKQIVQLTVQCQNLNREIDRLKRDNNSNTTGRIENILKMKEEEEIEYIRKINKLETLLRERQEQLSLTDRKAHSLSPRRNVESGNINRQLNDQIRLKDELITQLRMEIQNLKRSASDKGQSFVESLKLENDQLHDQLLLKEQTIERLGQQLKMRKDTLLRAGISQLEAAQLKNAMQGMQKKYATTFRSKQEVGINLARQLQKQIELSTKLKAQVDQLNFQLKRTAKQLNQLKTLTMQKQKVYEQEIQILANRKHKDEIVLQSRAVESMGQHYVLKGIQEELERVRSQLVFEKELTRKHEQSIRKITEDNAGLRKALVASEISQQMAQEETEVHRSESDRLRRFKKEFEIKQIECLERSNEIEEIGSKLELANAQLLLKNKAIKEIEKQLKDEVEAAQRRDSQFNTEIRKLRESKNKLQSDCKEMEDEKNRALEKMQFAEAERDKEKDYFASIQKKADSYMRMLEQQRQDKSNLQNELIEAKRDVTKYRLQKEELSRNYDILQSDYKVSTEKCKNWQEKVSQFQKQLISIENQLSINKDENRKLRQQLSEQTETANELRSVNGELMSANSQFARNEVEYVRKIQQLQRQISDLKNANDDYNPRYESLIERNKQLDRRNAELADMLNKAIERQANEYKDKVLGDVVKNAGNIYEHLKQSVVSTHKKRRSMHQHESAQIAQENEKSENKSAIHASGKSPQRQTKRQDPYKRMVSAKITDHKRRISQSAMKLVELLDVDRDKKSMDTLSDYQRINEKIESIEMQKSNLLNKINNYAEKLRIL